MTDLTRDWFHLLSTYRRQVKAMPVETDWVRGKLEEMLALMAQQAARHPSLKSEYDEVERPLVYFADEVLLNCQWDAEAAWAQDLLEKRCFGTQHGGQDFYARLTAALNGSTTEVLAVFHRCLVLGFQGKLAGRDLELSELRRSVHSRLGKTGLTGHRICPGAYEHLDARPFEPLPGEGTIRVVIGMLAMVAIIVFLTRWSVAAMWSDFVDECDRYVEAPPVRPEAVEPKTERITGESFGIVEAR